MTSALITGATSGIGNALALNLRSRGIEVHASGRNKEALLDLEQNHGCMIHQVDLGQEEAPETLWEDACRQLGGAPDWVINNAGYNSRKAELVETNNAEMDAQWRVNLRAPTIISRLALKEMTARKSGHLVNVVSTVAHLGIETMGLYSMMKHGLHGLTKVLIKEARPFGVKVTGVYPGGTDSGFREAERPTYMSAESAAHMVAGVLFAPEDVVVHELTFRPLAETNF